MKDISTPDFSTPSFNPGPFNPRLFNHELFNPRLLNPRLFNPRLFNHEIFNHEFLNHGVEKFMVEKSGVDRKSENVFECFSLGSLKVTLNKRPITPKHVHYIKRNQNTYPKLITVQWNIFSPVITNAFFVVLGCF